MKRFARFLYQPCLPVGEDGKRVTGSKEHVALSLKAAEEGMVLLKNEDALLPLKKGTKLAIFGIAQFDYVRGGGGSGDVTTAYTRNIYEGFAMKAEEGLVELFTPVSDFYRDSYKQQKEGSVGNTRCVLPSIDSSLVTEARAFTDTAVMTICRYSWEGGDRKGGAEDGDYYLSPEETALKNQLTSTFEKVIVILDVGGVVDSAWFINDKKIPAVLLGWQAGIEGGLAIANTVCGLSNPSGRLVDTFADSFNAYPSSAHFNDSIHYVDYTEDIYVGYRYFSTFEKEACHVNYPFGYGLSYTEFSEEVTGFKCAEGTAPAETVITVEVKVTNTGKVAGKNSVGLYASAPVTVLGRPERELVAFNKTGLLAPGESQTLALSFKLGMLASYDDLGKIAKSAYVLEKGEYRLFVGADVTKAVELKDTVKVAETVVTEQLTARCVPHLLKERLLRDGSFEALPTDDTPVREKTTIFNAWTTPKGRTIVGSLDASVKSTGTGVDMATEFVRQEEIPDFSDVADGKKTVEEFVKLLPIEVLIEMLGGQPNTGVANTFNMGNFTEFGIPSVPTADGPAGLRINPGVGVETTAWPIATMLACTWNTELVEEVGKAGGREVRENNIGLWLAPGMNIHRTPLCGRNFEYFSEDPLITGKMGAAVIRGMQSEQVGASMKHFCCNNKEEDRMTCDSRVSERALREIYLRGFEIAAKEANPWTVMSSYNLMNGCYNSENYDLLTGILREEWGYDGMVTTDWLNRVGHVTEVKAGNDVKMPIGEPQVLLDAFNAGTLTREDIEKCAGRVLKMILRF